ncbi:ATP11 protein-domain-containing protein [Podospora fimiseda]|uniref:ATP11 protein-domain-containing protein n=1 Tax=Podospora fimiseda TaxID=252190 RepID=A0AAN7BW55_9PEZI|nr:ATP11 protein-domain-containing protein [Podospora fimiseda]
MATTTIRSPVLLRRLFSPYSPLATRTLQQRRWAQVHDVRFLATTQQPRNVLEKYREKLDRKAKEEGLKGGVEELKEVYREKIEEFRRKADVVVDTTTPSPVTATATATATVNTPVNGAEAGAETKRNVAGGGGSGENKSGTPPLSTILDLEKALSLPEKELAAIWKYHHSTKANTLCAVIPGETFRRIEETAKKYPTFVLPVPHADQGAEIHFLQWVWDKATKSCTVLFTQLAEYKARGEFAQPHTSVTHYMELEGNKGVVLMRGEVVSDRGVKLDEARWLVMCLQKFYGGWEGEVGGEGKRELLEWFGRGDGRFSVERLLEESERIG